MIKLSLRTFVHYRLYSLINLLGLALSLTCVIIIARYIYSELTVDRFNTKLDRIYITTVERFGNQGNCFLHGIYNPNNEQNFVDISKHPGVEKHASFIYHHGDEVAFDNRTYKPNLLVIDSVFLQTLDYRVIAGANNICRPEDAFLTEAFAAKVFGKEDPIGKTFSYSSVNKTVTVVGIIRQPSHKSMLSFDMLVSSELVEEWGHSPQSLILLYPKVDYHDVNSRYNEFTQSGYWWRDSVRYQLFPYKDVYFNKHTFGFLHGNIVYISILSGIGILLLLIGLVNYINIHSVVMLRRNREFGMKKVFGAGSGRIFVQLFVENLLLTVVASVLAFWLVTILSPFVENTFDIRQYPNLRFDICLAITLIVLLPAVVSLAPCLRYRYFSPLRSLRSINAGNKSLFSRKFFLGFQYFITMGLIVVSLFFVRQLNFMLDKDLGFRTQNIIQVPFVEFQSTRAFNMSPEEYREYKAKIKTINIMLKQKMTEFPLTEHWSFGYFPIRKAPASFKITVADKETECHLFASDEAWFKVFDIQLLEGRLWNDELENSNPYNFIVTESTLKQLGIADYREALMQPIQRLWYTGSLDDLKTNPPYRIVGVVKDFHATHLSQRIEPTVFHFKNLSVTEPVMVAFAPERRQEVIEFMKNLHDELIGGEFTYSFIEDEITAMYNEDKKVAVICTVFTGIAIMISMLGLFGISLFDIRQRRKEIAIRKINGAQIIDIIRLLLRKYFVVLSIAFAASIPIALFAIYKYLENFAHKASVSWWLFATALAVTIAISLCTLLYQTYKAGNENPAEVIKSET
ncbi:MAG: ABC transporter permease [Prevotellaceae bacterium]|jgi:ABC-type antimicrobial peptide transport system permease subunit|nr:ABC transporter permease [Prevotellaceae bacterium]